MGFGYAKQKLRRLRGQICSVLLARRRVTPPPLRPPLAGSKLPTPHPPSPFQCVSGCEPIVRGGGGDTLDNGGSRGVWRGLRTLSTHIAFPVLPAQTCLTGPICSVSYFPPPERGWEYVVLLLKTCGGFLGKPCATRRGRLSFHSLRPRHACPCPFLLQHVAQAFDLLYVFCGDLEIQRWDSEGSLDATVVTYEYERYLPLVGWSHANLLPSEPPAWTNSDGRGFAPKSSFELPPEYEWIGDWEVQQVLDGQNGWLYGMSFHTAEHPRHNRRCLCRIRGTTVGECREGEGGRDQPFKKAGEGTCQPTIKGGPQGL